MNKDEYQFKISLYLDGELSPEEEPELLRLLDINKEARAYFEKQAKIKEVASTMKFKEPDEEIFNEYWPNVFNRLTRGVGWVLLIIVAVVVIGISVYQLFINPGVDTLSKVFTFVIMLAVVLLFISVIHQRIRESRTDKYKDVMK